jgi:hypothetical protein
MPRLPYLLLITSLLLVACKKDHTGDTIVSYSINGSVQDLSGGNDNFIQETYSSGEPLLVGFYFQHGDNTLIFNMGSFFFTHSFLEIDQQTFDDSLVVGKSFYNDDYAAPADIRYTNEQVGYFSTWHFYVTPTSIHDGEMDGTFSGMVVGTGIVSGVTVQDTISTGFFKNVPIERVYQ